MGGVNGVAVSRDMRCLMSVGQNRKLVFWDNGLPGSSAGNATGVLLQQFLAGEEDEGLAIGLSRCGGYLATGGTAGVVRLWRYPSGALLAEGRGHNAVITSLQFSPSDRHLVSGAVDGGVAVWYLDLQSFSRGE